MTSKTRNTRRDFLKSSLAMSGGLAAGLTGLANAEAKAPQGALDGKVALVTGAARGIGRAIAERYASEGAAVVMLDIADPSALPPVRGFRVANEREFNQAFEAVRALTPKVVQVKGDVRRLDDMQKAVTMAQEKFGGLDITVANAGYVRWHSFADGGELDWKSVFDVNVHGVFNSFSASIPALRSRGGGSLIALSSIGGRQGVPGNGAYTSSKWAVIGMVKQAAIELGSDNIRVNAIAPGPVNTPMYRSEGQMRSMGIKTAEEQDAMINPMLPLGDRPALNPSEIADSAVFLAGEAGAAISGTSLDVAYGYNAFYTA